MPLKLLADISEAVECAENSDQLRAVMVKFTQQLGFEHFAYVLSFKAPSLKPRQEIINGYPQAWVDRYLTQGYFKIDPLMRHLETSTLPASWESTEFHGQDNAKFWDEAQVCGLKAGLSFSVREQPSVTGVFSLARDQGLDMPSDELAALLGRAQLFASVLHHAVARIHLPWLLPEAHIALTARELECLKWAADGKTAWEIGKLMNITQRTAVFHINNVVEKLNASNKTQAVVRAVALKLV